MTSDRRVPGGSGFGAVLYRELSVVHSNERPPEAFYFKKTCGAISLRLVEPHAAAKSRTANPMSWKANNLQPFVSHKFHV